MKFGVRKPSLKKSFKARTTGKYKRQLKKAIIPGYGKKGTGFIKNPKKAMYNKVYNKTTIDPLKGLKTNSNKNRNSTSSKKQYNTKQQIINYEEYIGIYPAKFLNIHKNIHFNYNWNTIAVSNEPFVKNDKGPNEIIFLNKRHFLKSIFKKRYEKNLSIAKLKDEKIYNDWLLLSTRANKILNLDKNEIINTFNELKIVTDNTPISDELIFNFNNFDDANIILREIASKILPESFYNISTNRTKKYTKTEYFELYKQYIFSVLVRVGFEIFNLIPLNSIDITVNSSENKPIIRVKFYKDLLTHVGTNSASDIIYNYNIEYDFLKTKGFKELLPPKKLNSNSQSTNSDIDKILNQYPNDVEKYSLNDIELKFFDKLLKFFTENSININLISSNRLSDGTINLKYNNMQFGRIRLQGIKHKIQILSENDVLWNELKNYDYEEYFFQWLNYIKQLY